MPKPADKTKTQQAPAYAESVKKAFLMGLGATAMTAEKLKGAAADLAADLEKRGLLNRSEAKQWAEDLRRRLANEKSQWERAVKIQVQSTIHAMGLVTRKEMEAAVQQAAARAKKPVAKSAAKAKPKTKPAAKTGGKSPQGGKKTAQKKPAAKPAAAKTR